MTKLKYCTVENFDKSVGKYGKGVSQGFVDEAISWGLKCPIKWIRLKEIYYRLEPTYSELIINNQRFRVRNINKLTWTKIPTKIPDIPPGYGGQWVIIIFGVWKWYRKKLAKIRPVNTDCDRWESFVISYITIRRLASIKKHQNLSYVYISCKNAHKNHLKKEKNEKGIPIDYSIKQPNIDFVIDLKYIINKLPHRESKIIQMKLLEERDWESIGDELKISDRHVRRIYSETMSKIKERMKDYQ